jgi:murein DD-endopeptidase MepM/ murein hydrolase activator NlpD
MRVFLHLISIFAFMLLSEVHAELVWPTPNPAFQNGEPIEAFVQPTASGKKESGLFGCVRNNGYRFHEGLDLYPITRNKRREPLDTVYAILPGRVAYINKVAGHSSYGRYVVIEHDRESPAFHTLYAHLASIDDSLSVGGRVESGTGIGIMGRSASTPIPRSRAHLHFEIGFRLTDQFQSWYDRQKFSSKNRHGYWNGMNLVSIDPLGFYQMVRSGKVNTVYEYLKKRPTYARIRVHTSSIPDFVKRYPALVTRSYEGSSVVAWDIAFSKYGVPKEWTPRFSNESVVGQTGDVEILAYNPKLLKGQTCRRIINLKGSKPEISSATLGTIKKLFGFK